MKGIILTCAAELVSTKFGADKWKAVLAASQLPEEKVFLASDDVDDAKALEVIGNTAKVLNLSLGQVADAFGDYWVNDYAPKIYGHYYRKSKDARSFLLSIAAIHVSTTKSMANARPPKFEYSWPEKDLLEMKYISHRGLIDILVGLVKGVSRYYDEPLEITKVGSDKLHIRFLKE